MGSTYKFITLPLVLLSAHLLSLLIIKTMGSGGNYKMKDVYPYGDYDDGKMSHHGV